MHKLMTLAACFIAFLASCSTRSAPTPFRAEADAKLHSVKPGSKCTAVGSLHVPRQKGVDFSGTESWSGSASELADGDVVALFVTVNGVNAQGCEVECSLRQVGLNDVRRGDSNAGPELPPQSIGRIPTATCILHVQQVPAGAAAH